MFCLSEVISSFKSLRAGSHVFALLCCFFGILYLSAISMMFVKKYVGSVNFGGYGGRSESGLCVFRELCPVSFLVIGKSLSVLL